MKYMQEWTAILRRIFSQWRRQGSLLATNFLLTCRLSYQDMQKFHATDFAGNLSFLLTIGLMPFVMLILYLTSFIGNPQTGTTFLETFLTAMPDNIGIIIRPLVDELTSPPSGKLLSAAVISMLWSASAVVEGLRNILNRVYRVQHTPRYIFTRLLSVLQFLIIYLLIILAMFFLQILPEAINEVRSLLDIHQSRLQTVNTLGIFMVLITTVSLLYYVIPNHHQRGFMVFLGATVTSIGWIFFGRMFRLYFNSLNQLNYIYGGLFSIVVLQLFFYLISVIFIFGAEFSYHLLLLYRYQSISMHSQVKTQVNETNIYQL